MTKRGITVVGSICMDLVCSLPHLPARGETVLSRRFDTFVGGKGFNQALQAHRLGSNVSFFGKLGNDRFGDDVLIQLADENFSTTGISRDGTATALGMIMVEDGGMNYIAGFSGANMEFFPDDIPEESLMSALSNSSHLILQLEIPEETNRFTIDMARKAGCIIVMNFAPYRPVPEPDVEPVDLLIFNEPEASSFFGVPIPGAVEAMELLSNRPSLKNKVVITLGADGVVVHSPDGPVHVEGERVDAIDSTGAGDSFVGAMVHFLSKGADLLEAARQANHIAAISVTRMGAMPSLPTDKDI